MRGVVPKPEPLGFGLPETKFFRIAKRVRRCREILQQRGSGTTPRMISTTSRSCCATNLGGQSPAAFSTVSIHLHFCVAVGGSNVVSYLRDGRSLAMHLLRIERNVLAQIADR